MLSNELKLITKTESFKSSCDNSIEGIKMRKELEEVLHTLEEEILRVSKATAKLSFRTNSYADTIIYKNEQPSEATLTIEIKKQSDVQEEFKSPEEGSLEDLKEIGTIVKNAFKELTGQDATMITSLRLSSENGIDYKITTLLAINF